MSQAARLLHKRSVQLASPNLHMPCHGHRSTMHSHMLNEKANLETSMLPTAYFFHRGNAQKSANRGT